MLFEYEYFRKYRLHMKEQEKNVAGWYNMLEMKYALEHVGEEYDL